MRAISVGIPPNRTGLWQSQHAARAGRRMRNKISGSRETGIPVASSIRVLRGHVRRASRARGRVRPSIQRGRTGTASLHNPLLNCVT